MPSDKIYAIGDIHGELGLLRRLLSLLDKDIPIVFIGDYIDHGLRSNTVVSLVRYMVDKGHIALKGNHEDMAIMCHEAGEEDPDDRCRLWLFNGGHKTLKSYSSDRLPDSVVEWMKLPLIYEWGNYLFVHAGLEPGYPIGESPRFEEGCMWIRNSFINSDYDWGKIIVFGHTPQFSGPLIMPNKICIDTGAFYYGKLTAVLLPDMKFITVGREH